MSLGDRPMSRAWAATMNNTKIAVMVKSASPKERDDLDRSRSAEEYPIATAPVLASLPAGQPSGPVVDCRDAASYPWSRSSGDRVQTVHESRRQPACSFDQLGLAGNPEGQPDVVPGPGLGLGGEGDARPAHRAHPRARTAKTAGRRSPCPGLRERSSRRTAPLRDESSAPRNPRPIRRARPGPRGKRRTLRRYRPLSRATWRS